MLLLLYKIRMDILWMEWVIQERIEGKTKTYRLCVYWSCSYDKMLLTRRMVCIVIIYQEQSLLDACSCWINSCCTSRGQNCGDIVNAWEVHCHRLGCGNLALIVRLIIRPIVRPVPHVLGWGPCEACLWEILIQQLLVQRLW